MAKPSLSLIIQPFTPHRPAIGPIVARRMIGLLLLVALLTPTHATAQTLRPKEAWQPAYQQLPDFPLENTYINRITNRPEPNNTLIGRIIRYHVYTKQRPINYRLDWKLTLADYLNANDIMDPAFYPGHDTLRQNPLDTDRAAISKLTRAQRDALVQTLVTLFTTAPSAPPVAKPAPSPAPASGGASLLK